MSAIGNLLWFLGGGLIMGLGWWITGVVMFCSILGIPWGRSCFVLGNLGTGCLGLAGNIIWFIFGGLWLALGHAFWGVVCAITIIGIPFALQHWKLAGLAMAPIGKTIVSKQVAAAARRSEADEYVRQVRRS
jgi:uncharacterized membrane protein YccF (DUF307 family)